MNKEPFTNHLGERLTNKEIQDEIKFLKSQVKTGHKELKTITKIISADSKELKIYETMLEKRKKK